MPKIACLVERNTYLRLIAPVARNARERGWEIEWWLQHEEGDMGYKAHLATREEQLPLLPGGPAPVRRYRNTDLNRMAAENKVDFVISLIAPDKRLDAPPETFRAVLLQSGVDTLLRATVETFSWCDLTCFYTPYWEELATKRFSLMGPDHLAAFNAIPRDRFMTGGSPQFDILDDLDPGEIRRKHDIPVEPPMVLLFPYPITPGVIWGDWAPLFAAETVREQISALRRGIDNTGFSFLRRFWNYPFKGTNDRRFMESVRAFCDRNGATLVAKSRLKHPFRPAVLELADHCIYDKDFYPSTTLELAAAADLCIHPNSTGALEFAAAGKFSLCAERPYPFSYPLPEYLIHEEFFSLRAGGIFNFPGVNDHMSPQESIARLPEMSLDDFRIEAEALRAYRRLYLDEGEGSSSKRVLDAMEGIFARKGPRRSGPSNIVSPPTSEE